MTERGRLITFEGGEGAGKSTQIRRLGTMLVQAGLEVVTTREPGGTEGAEAIRSLVTEGTADRWSPLTETLLFLAARQDHVERLVEPALAEGRWVLCDRFIDSTRVYQGIAGKLSLDLIDRLHDVIFDRLSPDLTLLLDLPVEAGLARRQAAGESNRFEQKVTDFHQAVRAGFLDLAAAEPERFAVIDAAEPIEAVQAAVIGAVKSRLLSELTARA
ncbi:MAG: dTMP kinase [Alphaproteobacteria bacterium]|nr:dTMP kinase [Alphaproteobacteria bacterium]